MEGQDEEQAVEMFQSITGADESTARHVLDAHSWDLNRGVSFFLEYGSGDPMVDLNGTGSSPHSV